MLFVLCAPTQHGCACIVHHVVLCIGWCAHAGLRSRVGERLWDEHTNGATSPPHCAHLSRFLAHQLQPAVLCEGRGRWVRWGMREGG